MGLSTTLGTAIAGLQATQAGISVISQNVANAGTTGYVRRTIATQEVNGGGVVATGTTHVQRQLDQIVQRKLWEESAGAAYTGAKATALASVDQMFGQPGSTTSFDAIYNAFTSALQSLTNDPTSYAYRTAVLDRGSELAMRLNELTAGIQDLRATSEAELANATTDVNRLLANLTSLNNKIIGAGKGDAAASLKDERDRVLADLSQYMDIRTTEDDRGSISIFTGSGLQLFDGRPAVSLSFDEHPGIGATALWSADGSQRGVGTLLIKDGTGGTRDAIINNAFRSGKIAAHVELRDKVLVQAQAQLDEIAAHLSSALSDREVKGVPPAAPASPTSASTLTLNPANLEFGNTLTLEYRASPTAPLQRLTIVDAAAGTTIPASARGDASNRVIPFTFGSDFSAVAGALETAINTALGTTPPASGFSVAGTGTSTLAVTANGGWQVAGLTARPTATTTQGGTPELPFFVDRGKADGLYTGSFEGQQQFTGFAGRIAINPDLVSQRNHLVQYATTTLSGDSARPALLLDRLTNATLDFTRAVGVDGATATSQTTLSSYVQRVVASQGQSYATAQRLDEGQKVALSAVQNRFQEASRVSVDQEMSQLIELQSAYAANARLISSVKEMFDVLLRI